jgi:hypothetical protein
LGFRALTRTLCFLGVLLQPSEPFSCIAPDSYLRDEAGDAEYVFTNPDTETRYTDIKEVLLSSMPRSGYHQFHLS